MLFLALASCDSQPVVRDRLIVAPIPAPLLSCLDAPPVPGETATQRDAAFFMIQLYGAWDDCSQNLRSVRDMVAAQKAYLAAHQN